jgi:hypothetical protein
VLADADGRIFGADGRLFFTLQGANVAGRLDPATGAIDLVTMPVEGSRPYGIKRAPDDAIWIAANGASRLYRLDPETMAVEEHPIPDEATRIRRLSFASVGDPLGRDRLRDRAPHARDRRRRSLDPPERHQHRDEGNGPPGGVTVARPKARS